MGGKILIRKNMNIIRSLLVLSALYFSANAVAAHVECVISGTPTQQQYTADYCSSIVNAQPSIWYRLVTSKPVLEVTWSHDSGHGQSWSCGNSTTCIVNLINYSNNGSFTELSACANRVIYTDNTWEDLNVCASGIIWGGSINPF